MGWLTDMIHRILTAHGDYEYVLKSDLLEAVAGYKKLIQWSLYETYQEARFWPYAHNKLCLYPDCGSEL